MTLFIVLGIIVGANLGFEVDILLNRYKNCSFLLFEGSPRYFKLLTKRFFTKQNRVQVFDCLIGDVDDQVEFFETNMEGSGSILEVGKLANSTYGLEQKQKYLVPCRKLDSHAIEHGYANEIIDCLWIDVQGAELLVLNGAVETLKKVKSLFLEVSVYEELYIGGAKMTDLFKILDINHFQIVSLGIDPSNGTGNAFYVNTQLLHFSRVNQ